MTARNPRDRQVSQGPHRYEPATIPVRLVLASSVPWMDARVPNRVSRTEPASL